MTPVPRYFFNVHHEIEEIDFEGEELPDKHAAWEEATKMAGQILQDLDGKLKPEIMDEFRNRLIEIHIHANGASRH